MYQSRKETLKRAAKVAIGAAAMGAGAAFADTEAAISALQATVLGFIGLGVAAGFAVLAASLAPDIGMSLTRKWIKKGAK